MFCAVFHSSVLSYMYLPFFRVAFHFAAVAVFSVRLSFFFVTTAALVLLILPLIPRPEVVTGQIPGRGFICHHFAGAWAHGLWEKAALGTDKEVHECRP
jgi:hypothetical protein